MSEPTPAAAQAPPTTDRERWNAKFRAGEAQSVEPDPLLVETCASWAPGTALDLAGGAGRHALWLAQRGWRVTLSDISEEALALAHQRCTHAQVGLALRRESASATLQWAREQPTRFDLIAIFWILLRDQFHALPAALAPGGRLLYKTYNSLHPRFTEGHSLRFALEPGELRTAFPALEILHYRESEGVAELVARARE